MIVQKSRTKDGLHYRLVKNPDNEVYVFLVHGLFGSMDNLSVLEKSLQQHFSVISIDLPDHGNSDFSIEFSFDSYANKLLGLMAELNISKGYFVGHSLGGKVCMQLALNYAHKVQALVVADIAPVAYPPRHNAVFQGLNNVNLATLTNRKQAEKALNQYIDEQGIIQFLLKSLYRQSGQWHWRFNLAMLQRDYNKLINQLHSDTAYLGPVLFIKGGDSDYIQPTHRQAILTLFPNSKAKIIQGAGHWLHADKPKVFNRMVTNFFSQ